MWVLFGISVALLTQFSLSGVVSPVYPVYASNILSPLNSSDSISVVVGSTYRANSISANRRSKVSVPEEPEQDDWSNDEAFIGRERDACMKHSITSCWTLNAMGFIRNLLQPSNPAASMPRSYNSDAPQLVRLPGQTNESLTILGRSGYWGLGSLYYFFEKQLSNYIEGHGILFPATSSWEEGITDRFQTPVVMDNETDREIEDSRHKTKKKHSILFPLLVLFKFFKIKMILIPILLTVLLVKKLLIATLALAPNLAGFFRVCRPPFGQLGLAPAGLLQDVSDSRGEFSTLYNNYANPYRDYHGYKYRDMPRYSEPPPKAPEALPDY